MTTPASSTAVPMSAITQSVSHVFVTSPPPISVSVSTSPDYIIDGLTAFYSLLTLILAIIAFRSFRVTRKQSQDALDESRKQSEAALQVAREANAATLKTIEEMREARDQDSAPYVVASFELDSPMISFVVKNLGKSVAKEIEQIRKSFEELNATSKKMAKALKEGFWIKNSEILSINLNLEDTTCLSFIGTKLQEFKTKWQVIYGKTVYRVY